jgi:hypothetical protein
MKKLLPIFFILFLFSCKKEDLKDNSNNNSDTPTPCTIKLYKEQFVYALQYCVFSYTDVNGVVHNNLYETDMTIENVDFSKPLSVEASAGITMYNPGATPPQIYTPQVCDWQLKKDGIVIDTRSTSNYLYSN